MRRFMATVLAAGLWACAAGTVRADEEANQIIDKAVAAHGGAEIYAKQKGGYMKGRGKLEIMGGLEIAQEIHYALPDKFKEVVEFEVMGQKITTETICNGEKVVIKANGQEVPVDEKIKDAVREAVKTMQFGRLTSLKNKDITLATLGESKVEGKPALGIKVSAKGQKDVDLYFDKETHLLVKMERKGINPSGEEVNEERLFLEYKKTGKFPEMKKVVVKHDGKTFIELEVLETKILETVDENLFAIP